MLSKRDPQTYRIIGAAMVVHRELGPGFLEAVYHEALSIEFEIQSIPYIHEVELPIHYKGRRLKKIYRADFVCYDDIIVELKALSKIAGKEKSQVINYLKASNHDRGLLLNFGAASLEVERLANSRKKSASS
ncbi:MAG: GxxExxY protein [Chloroflexi bacterium]|nr:GxxExxY protein [Chloroflexota bacterium]